MKFMVAIGKDAGGYVVTAQLDGNPSMVVALDRRSLACTQAAKLLNGMAETLLDQAVKDIAAEQGQSLILN